MPDRGATARWLACLLCGLSGAAQADPFGTFGFGARAASMGGAQTAAAEDYTGVYYNPATLTVHKSPHAGLGMSLVVPKLSVQRDGPPGPNAGKPILPSSNVGVQVGVLFPLGGLIENRFAVGIGLNLPTVNVTRVNAVDPETPTFYRYGALTEKMTVNLGVAFELHETVSLGLGYQVLGTLEGTADVELDPLTQRFTRKELQVDVRGDSGLTAGLLIRPTPDLRFGLAYRESLQLDYRLITTINIKDAGLLEADIFGTSLFTPDVYAFGSTWRRGALRLSADLVWARWSTAPDPSAQFNVRFSGEPLGLGEILATPAQVDLGAVDTLSPKVGAEYAVAPDWLLRAGYSYEPTPLPAQTGYTNFVDSDTHLFAVGVGYTFPDPLRVHRSPLSADLAVQYLRITDRRADKVDPEDSFGSYSAGGGIWQLALSMRHDFE